MGRKCQIYDLLRFDHITQDLKVPPANVGEGSGRWPGAKKEKHKKKGLVCCVVGLSNS